MPKKIVYLDKPEFHKADPNNPIQYILKPQGQTQPEESFQNLRGLLTQSAPIAPPTQEELQKRFANPPEEPLAAGFKRPANDPNHVGGNVHHEIQQFMDDIGDKKYSDNQIEDIRRHIASNPQYDEGDRNAFEEYLDDQDNN